MKDERRTTYLAQLIVCLFMAPVWFYFASGNAIPGWFLWLEFAFTCIGVLLNSYKLSTSS